MDRPARLLIAGLLVLVAVVALPLAAAHAVVIDSSPKAGTRLTASPHYVTATFNEPIDEVLTFEVVDAQDRTVDLGDVSETGDEQPMLRVSLPLDLPDGAYRVRWAVLSGDQHTVRGTIGFAIGDFAPPDSHATGVSDLAWLGAVGRFLAFTGLALGLGAALFLAWVPGGVALPRRPTLEALVAGAALHLIGVALLTKSTLDQTGLAPSALAATSVGQSLFLRLGLALGALAFAGIALAPRMSARGPPYLAAVALAVAGLGSARFSHAGSLAGLPGVAVDALHLLAATAWAGGLLVFLWLLVEARRLAIPADALRAAGIRFGTAALGCVILLAAAGLGASLAILGPAGLRAPAATLASPWGRLLAAKVALTLVMIGIATVNRFGILAPATDVGVAGRIQGLLARRAPTLRSLEPSGGGLRRLLRVEALLGVAVLAVAGLLTSISPPAAATETAGPLEVQGFGVEFHGELRLSPAPRVDATSTLRVHVETHAGVPVEDNTCGATSTSCLTVLLGQNGTGTRYQLTPLGGGDWEAQDLLWTAAGDWTAEVSVVTADTADKLVFAFQVAA